MNMQPTQPQLPPPPGKAQTPVAIHRRQTMWQVWVPLGVSILIVIGLAIWASLATAQNAVVGSQWADVSLIFLILPAFLICLIILAILFLIVYGLGKLNANLPIFALRLQGLVYRIETGILSAADAITKPVLAVNGATAAVRNFTAHFRRRKQPRDNRTG